MPSNKPRSSYKSPSISMQAPPNLPDIPKSGKTGHFIVAYDIGCPKRLRKVANCCLDYGFRAQYSLFECRLTWQQFETFWRKLMKCIDPEEDRLLAFPIHGAYLEQIRRVGNHLSLHPQQCYVL